MRITDVDEAIREAKRFLVKAKKLKKHSSTDRDNQYYNDGQLVASVKRASLDMAKATILLRRSKYDKREY